MLKDVLGKGISPNGFTPQQLEYFVVACKSLEANDIENMACGSARGFGGSTSEGDAALRKQKRALYDYLELQLRQENKNG